MQKQSNYKINNMKLKLTIIDLNGIYLEDEVDLINLTISSGNVTILANHLPLISNIEISHLYTKKDGVITNYAIAGGVLFVSDEGCKIITQAIENENEVDFTRAQLAKDRAEERISLNDGNVDIKRAEIALKKAINRLSLR